MSNWKYAYGWSGHIVSDETEGRTHAEHNVIAIPQPTFDRILSDCKNDVKHEWITIRALGITSDSNPTRLLAVGTGLSEGFTYYGTVFEEAEARCSNGPMNRESDRLYLAAMKEIYGLDLPPCRLMIGCSSEMP